MVQDGTWHGGRPRFGPHCARWGPSSPPKKGAKPLHFSAHFYCGQTAVCIRIPLGTEVCLSLGDIVLDEDPAPHTLEGHNPQLSANGQTAGWTKMPLGMQLGLGQGNFVFDGDPAPPEKKAHAAPPNFWPMSIVAKRLDG